jgi:hypothetical protein
MIMPVNTEARTGYVFRRSIEYILAISTIFYGVAMIMVPEDFGQTVLAFKTFFFFPSLFFGVLILSISVARLSFLIVNGYWPWSAKVRQLFSLATFLLVWSPLTAGFAWFAVEKLLGNDYGAFLPGGIMAPSLGLIEGLCLYTLAALGESQKNDARGTCGNDRRGGSDDSRADNRGDVAAEGQG